MEYLSKYSLKIVVLALSCITQMESNWDDAAIGDNGLAYGSLQIHQCVIDDVNKNFNKNYCHDEMFEREKAVEVYYYYMALLEIDYISRYYDFPPEQYLVQGWNSGRGRQKDITSYYKAFLNCKE